MFQFGKYSMDILEMLSGHQAHQFKGLGLERQLQHQQQVQLHQHQQQLQQQQQQNESSGALIPGISLGSLQGSRGNTFADSSSYFAKMSAPPPIQQQALSSSSQGSRKSSKMGINSGGGSGGPVTGYPQFLRSFHPTDAALTQEQLHSGMGRFEHFAGGSIGGGTGVIGGVVTPAPPLPPPPLHPVLSVPQASPGPSSSSPSPSSSASTSNNPSSSSTSASLGQQLVGAQSDARSLHQQFSCMLAANQYFLSGVPANSSLEQFFVQQGTHNHLSLGLGQGSGESNSALAPPPALHPSNTLSHHSSQQQQQQLAPHALSHPHSHHHPLHPVSQPSTLGGFDFQGIPVLSSNQIASLMQQETGLPLPLPLHLSFSKNEGKGDSGAVAGESGGGRRKKAMAGYLPQRKLESNNNSNSTNCRSGGDPNPGSSSGRHALNATSDRDRGVNIPNQGEDPLLVNTTTQSSSSSTVSVSSSSVPSLTSASVLVTNELQLAKPEVSGVIASTAAQSEPEPLYHCGECSKTFTHLSSFRRHIRSHGLATGNGNTGIDISNTDPNHNHLHPSDPSVPNSTQDVTSQSNHQQPQQTSVNLQQLQSNSAPTSSSSCSSPEKTHCCPECGKRFKKRGHLLQHGVIHSGVHPFSCSICQRAFNRRESLTRHEKIHEGKPYRCPACGRCFRENTSLLNHAASGTCGKPGRLSQSRESNCGGNSSMTAGGDEPYRQKSINSGAVMAAGGSGVGEYHVGQVSDEGVLFGKTEEDDDRRVVDCIMEVEEEEEDGKAGLACESLFQQERGVTNNGGKIEPKYSSDFSRNQYQASYEGDNYCGDYKPHRSQTNLSCYPGEPSCGHGVAGPALRKAPLAPTLHPHPQNQTQQQQQTHLPLSSLLDDTEEDVTSSVSNAMSAIAAAATTSCVLNSGGVRSEERRDIIGGLLGGLSFGPLDVSPSGPSSTSGIDKTYREDANEESMTLTHQNHQQTPSVKPKRPRKPRPRREPRPGGGGRGEDCKRRRNTQNDSGTRGERERPFLCSVCGRGFSRRETLRRHDRVHTGEKPHCCPVCGKNFREAFHLSKHRTVHSGEKNYKCSLCGKEFGYAQSLKRHGKVHQKGDFGDAARRGANTSGAPTPPRDTSPENGRRNSDSYYSYSQDKSPGSSTLSLPKLYTCALCWKSFRHHFHLTAHHQAIHEGGDRLFCCEVCGKAFAYANSLTRHRFSQHGLSRTRNANQTGIGGEEVSRISRSDSVSGSEAVTNNLQLLPPSGADGAQQVNPHAISSPLLQPASSISPLLYHPESGAALPTTSNASHSNLPLPHSSHLSNYQQPTSINVDPIYPTGQANLLTSTLSPFFPLSQQQQQHHQQHFLEVQSFNLKPQKPQFQGERKCKIKNKKREQGIWDLRGEFSILSGSVKETPNSKHMTIVGRQKDKRFTKQSRKIGKIHPLKLKKKKLAELLRVSRGGRTWRGEALNIECLSSLKVPQKHFPCPYCPSTTFPRQAALLVHRATRHPPRTCCHQARLECPVCGKHFRKLYTALSHRGSHLAQGSFSCSRCSSRFWNGALLKRHKVACRSLGGGIDDCHFKPPSQTKTTLKKEDMKNNTAVLME